MIFAFVVSFIVVRKIIFSRGRTLKIAVAFYSNVIGVEFASLSIKRQEQPIVFPNNKKKPYMFQFLICFTRSSVGRGHLVFFPADQIIVAGN